MTEQKNRKIITIIGGGNSTHSLIPLLSDAGHTINLLTRNPEKWSKEVVMEYTDPNGKIISTLKGNINEVSKIPQDIIPQSDIIILSLPVSIYRIMLNKVGPFINKSKKVVIGTIYGQGGFNWMVEEIKKKYDLNRVVAFACGLLPWITRTKEYGSRGTNYGPKSVNVVAVDPKHEFDNLNKILFNDICFTWFKTGKFQLSDNFISLTLSVDNQVIHLSRLFGLNEKFGGKWEKQEDVPLFYRDYDEFSANLLRSLDDDFSKIRNKIKTSFPQKKFTYMLNYLDLERLSYNSANENIMESFISSKTLGQIPTPTVKNNKGIFVFDKTHRFFTDDLFYGLIIAKWFAENLKIETKTIDRIIYWAQEFIDVNILKDDKLIVDYKSQRDIYKYGLPSVYGYKTIEDVID